MNYFAHAWHWLDDPWVAAGTAVPDWLGVVNRRVRARSKAASPLTAAEDPRVAALARGIVQHHHDDAWFHGTRAFAELSLDLTVRFRDLLGAESSMRPSFLGHILVELLLDAELARRDRARLERYYAVLAQIEPPLVEQTVERIAGRPAERLAYFIGRFIEVRFLFDYLEDAKLWFRLNQVMGRVGLDQLPESVIELIGEARPLVAERTDELLTPPEQSAR